MSQQKAASPRRSSVDLFARAHKQGQKLVLLTAYDALFARLQDQAGVDAILVGDSAGMVVAGHDTTLPVTMDQMLYHTACVSRAVQRAFVIADMPFLSVQLSREQALANCGRMLAEGGAQAVKIEGGQPIAPTIRAVVEAGIPVMGHLGLVPQSIHSLGSYRTRGVEADEAERLRQDAQALEQAGCFAIVLEKVEPTLAAGISGMLSIPTIGIGSGVHCGGQVLVNADMLGLFEEFRPRFVRRFAELAGEVRRAVGEYGEAVRSGRFPGKDEV
jgi:3-methyl-2-oxobutanoate hydroxymethyltransferase